MKKYAQFSVLHTARISDVDVVLRGKRMKDGKLEIRKSQDHVKNFLGRAR